MGSWTPLSESWRYLSRRPISLKLPRWLLLKSFFGKIRVSNRVTYFVANFASTIARLETVCSDTLDVLDLELVNISIFTVSNLGFRGY